MHEIDRVFTKYPFFHCPLSHILCMCCRAAGQAIAEQSAERGKSPDCGISSPVRIFCWSSSCSSPDGHHGATSDLQEPKYPLTGNGLPANHERWQKAPSAPYLSVSAEKAVDHAAQSSSPLTHVNMRCRSAGAATLPTFRSRTAFCIW